MSEGLRERAQRLLAAAPCSVELPAGTGKTHLVAAAAAVAAQAGDRSLILTHTNAGVDALRRRLGDFAVPSKSVRVETISSWALALVRSYPVIAGMPDIRGGQMTITDAHIAAASLVAMSRAVTRVHAESFTHLFVDEYQDCTTAQHDFVLALAAAVPRTVVLGDRLQAIFGFAGALVDWDKHVLESFPAHSADIHPHRWVDHNLELGHWLLGLRDSLYGGAELDLAAHRVSGLSFVRSNGPMTITTVARSFRSPQESVVIIDKWPRDIAQHASRLQGAFTVMEDLGGTFMRTELERLPPEGQPGLAAWLAQFAKKCMIGLGELKPGDVTKLERGQKLGHLRRPGLESVTAALDRLLGTPTYSQLLESAAAIRQTPSLHLYRREAWKDGIAAVQGSLDDSDDVVASLARVRDRLRHTGRSQDRRVASRTLLVKGLEYDHVVIADLARMASCTDLYVALSRARKSVTIIGRSSTVRLIAGSRPQ